MASNSPLVCWTHDSYTSFAISGDLSSRKNSFSEPVSECTSCFLRNSYFFGDRFSFSFFLMFSMEFLLPDARYSPLVSMFSCSLRILTHSATNRGTCSLSSRSTRLSSTPKTSPSSAFREEFIDGKAFFSLSRIRSRLGLGDFSFSCGATTSGRFSALLEVYVPWQLSEMGICGLLEISWVIRFVEISWLHSILSNLLCFWTRECGAVLNARWSWMRWFLDGCWTRLLRNAWKYSFINVLCDDGKGLFGHNL